MELFCWIRRWYFWQAEAGHQTQSGEREQDQRGTLLTITKGCIEQPTDCAAGDDRRKSAQFQDAVSPGQPFFREKFWEQAILRQPYFDGPKKALCTPMPQTAAIASGTFFDPSAASAKSINKISKTLTPSVTLRLLNRSAR